MRRLPPHILVTTPESLYVLLTSASGRDMLRTVRTFILDEIHALAGSKRGAHLALSLERLEALAGGPLQRIGISATQGAVTDMAHFLFGTGETGSAGVSPAIRGSAGIPPACCDCTIIDLGHSRPLDLGLEIPASPLEAVMAGEVWGELYDRLANLALEHRTALIFVNTRRLAERVAHHLSERLGADWEHRREAEGRLKAGTLRALVATASLELGIDIGDRPGVPARFATVRRRPAATGRSLRPCLGGYSQGPTVPPVPRRPGRVYCTARGGTDVAARPHPDPPPTPGCAGPADRRRGRRPGLR